MTTLLTSAAGSPLGWVHPEIEVALDEVLRALDGADWNDAASRIVVLAQLHQVSGALHMVELPGPHRLAEELEGLLGESSQRPIGRAREACEAAITALRSDLERRLQGQLVRDLDALPVLQMLGRERAREYSAVELFFPDLLAFPAGQPSQSTEHQAAARACRADFQRALLGALRTPLARDGLNALAEALRRVATQAPGWFGHARWTLIADLLEVMTTSDPLDRAELRRFYTRIDRQLRVSCSSQDQPNDRLLREALHLATCVGTPGPRLTEALRAARVAELLAPPSQPSAAPAVNPRHEALVQALARAEDQLEGWFREQASHLLPAVILQQLTLAADQLDMLGEDAALMLLEEARQELTEFPAAAQLTESRIEPVAERLAGLHQYAQGLLASDPQAAGRLDVLRERLLSLPGAAPVATRRRATEAPDLVAHHIDETLFGVFLEEADILLRSLHVHAQSMLLDPLPPDTIEAARATLQTLRGSGLVAGLIPLAQLCGEIDHTLAAWTPRGERAWDAPARLVAESARTLERWLAMLAGDRDLRLPAIELIDTARRLRAQPALALAPLISLQDIFLEEAGDRLEDLRGALGQDLLRVQRPADAFRAVHTLAGIARTAGHPGMAELARAMETVIEVLRKTAATGPACIPVHERLHTALGALADMRAVLVAGRPLVAAEELVRALRRDAERLQEASREALLDNSPPVPDTQTRTVAAAAAVPAEPPSVTPEPGDDLVDQPDQELLPVFLEECAELMPQLDAALRVWSEGGNAAHGSRALKRGLHTLKGSARMSGLFRQGGLAHRLEDLVLRWSEDAVAPTAQAFEDIQAGLDELALGIERLAHPGAASQPALPTSPAAGPAPAMQASPAAEAAPAATPGRLADPDASASASINERMAADPRDVVDLDRGAFNDAVDGSLHPAPEQVPGQAELAGDFSADRASLAETGAKEPSPPLAAEAGDGPEPVVVPEPVAVPEPVVLPEPVISQAPVMTPEPVIALEPPGMPEPAVTGVSAVEHAGTAAERENDVVSPVLRLRVETLDRMANAAGEAGIGRARLETEASALKRGLGDLAENIQRLKAQLREVEIHAERALPATLPEAAARHGFDPLEMDRYSRLQELARTLAEGIDDVQTVHQGLRRGVDEVELALRQQGRVIRDLQQDLLRARMVPFASLAERLQRTTRQAARECGRELHFHLEGGQHEVDRSILERLAAPIEHLLRNAAVHGVEDADSRRQLGKPAHGQLTIQLTQGEHEVSLRISDDGRGVDLGRVRARAEANGLLLPGQACPDEELLQLIFRPGFSTASSVTSLAGRGVGLDVVRSEVLGLGGRIHLDTRPGAGTDFTLVIPVTLATVQAVVVRAGDAWFAIPAPLVEQVRPVARDALIQLYRERVAVWQGLRYPFTSLNRVLGLSLGEPEPQGSQQLVFLRSADRRCALRVDELAGTQEIVVKAVSPHLARIPGVTGASVLGNGRIVLILNPVPLAVGADGMIPAALLPAEPVPQAPTVMVVDDSITVRRVTSRLLERAGFQVQLAKDGEDALEQLQDTGHALPGAVLLDVEMPRMDGFELIARLRSDARTAGLPVVVITSRTAERHRNHADSLGVQGYLGKPYREEDLLALLADLVPAPGEPKTATPGGRPVLTVVP